VKGERRGVRGVGNLAKRGSKVGHEGKAGVSRQKEMAREDVEVV